MKYICLTTVFFLSQAFATPAFAQTGDGQIFRADCSILTDAVFSDDGEIIKFPQTISEFSLELPYGQRKELYRDAKGSYTLIFGDSMHVVNPDGVETYNMQFILAYKNAVTGDSVTSTAAFDVLPTSISMAPGKDLHGLNCSARQ